MTTPAADAPERQASLVLTRDVFDAMVAHCLREAPNEACGILGGLAPVAADFFPLRNIRDSPTRYEADPKQVVDAAVKLRQGDREILAIYHSHPDAAAVPSQVDLELNYYGTLPRIIVSLRSRPAEVRAWILNDRSFEEILYDIRD